MIKTTKSNPKTKLQRKGPKIAQKLRKKAEQSHGPTVNAPVAKTVVSKTPAPKIKRSAKNGDVVVEHTEFLQDITGSQAFAVNAFAVNPGLSQTFPWLSQMARLFESYRFEALDFDFRTEAGTTATGSVMAAIDYDASDAPPTTKRQLATYRGYKRSAPWNSFVQSSIREDLSKRQSYYVRSSPVPAGSDVKLYDVGNLFLATQLQANNSVVGELYVRYRVKLMTPQLQDPALGSALSGRYTYGPDTATAVAGSNSPLVPSGGSTVSGSNAAQVLTATDAYNCLVTWSARCDGPITVDTTASTASIQVAQLGTTAGTAQISLWNAQVKFLPGQTLFVVTECHHDQSFFSSRTV